MKWLKLEEVNKAGGSGWATYGWEGADDEDDDVANWAFEELVNEGLLRKGNGLSFQITMRGKERLSRPEIDPVNKSGRAILIALSDRNVRSLSQSDVRSVLGLSEVFEEDIDHINDVVELLEELGVVETDDRLGSGQYNFNSITPNGSTFRAIVTKINEGWDLLELLDKYHAHDVSTTHYDNSNNINIDASGEKTSIQAGIAGASLSQHQEVYFSPFDEVDEEVFNSGVEAWFVQLAANRVSDNSHKDVAILLEYMERVDSKGKTTVDIAREGVAMAQKDGHSRESIERSFKYIKQAGANLGQGLSVNFVYDVLKMIITTLVMS